MNKYEELVIATKEEFPGFDIRVSNLVPLFAITLGKRVYVKPSWRDVSWQVKYATLRHEIIHIRQQKAMGLGNIWIGLFVFGFLYLLLFFPVLFAYFRWRWERVAYVESMRAWKELGDNNLLDNAAAHTTSLAGRSYGWSWPRPLVKRYFEKQARLLEGKQ